MEKLRLWLLHHQDKQLSSIKNAFVDYINKHNYTGIQALVAFSGKVNIDGN